MWSILLPNQTSTGDAIPSWVFDDTGHSAWDPDNNIMILGASTGMYASYGWNPGWVMKVAIDMNKGTATLDKEHNTNTLSLHQW